MNTQYIISECCLLCKSVILQCPPLWCQKMRLHNTTIAMMSYACPPPLQHLIFWYYNAPHCNMSNCNAPLCDGSFFDIATLPSAAYHFSLSSAMPPSVTSHSWCHDSLSSAMPSSAMSHFLTSHCPLTATSHISMSCTNCPSVTSHFLTSSVVPPSATPHFMMSWRPPPQQYLNFWHCNTPLFTPSSLQPYLKWCNCNCSCRVNTLQS